MHRDFKGIWIPKEIYLDKELSWTQKILLIEIDSLDMGDEHCFASDDYFMEFLGLSRRTIQGNIAFLKEKGFISLVSFDGRKRILRSCISDMQKSAQRKRGKVHSGSAEKCTHNNTSNNTINIETTNVVSCPSHKKVTDTASKQIQFNRKSGEFDGLNDEKLLKLKETYPNLDISQEIGKMKLWLEENPKGKRRKGTWRFILDWISRTSEQHKFSTDKQFKNSEQKEETNSNALESLRSFFSFYDSWYDNLMDKFLIDRGKVILRDNKLAFYRGEKEYLATPKNLSWMLEKCCVPNHVVSKAEQLCSINA